MRRLRIASIEIRSYVLRKYLRSRFFMGLLRRYPRLAWLPGRIRLVVHHDEAVRVFKDSRSYAVPYLRKMEELGAPFLLGLDHSPDHTRQRQALRDALEPVAITNVAETTRAAAERALRGETRIEVVRGLTDAVLRETIGAHLGTGAIDDDQLDAARMVFRHIFINPFNSPDVVDAAKLGGARLLDHVRDVVADRRAAIGRGGEEGKDVLGRLMAAMGNGGVALKDDEELAAQLVGLLVAWAASVSRTTAYALDALLERPQALERAHRAARERDIPAMQRLLAEAMRVQPPVPAVERICLREGPVEGATVKREQPVSIVLTAVTMDDAGYDGARRFDAGRPGQDQLAFGHDLHRCLGFELATRQLTEIAIALLRRPGVRRAGKLRLLGPYPDKLEVTFGAI